MNFYNPLIRYDNGYNNFSYVHPTDHLIYLIDVYYYELYMSINYSTCLFMEIN